MERLTLGLYSANYAACLLAVVVAVLQARNLRNTKESFIWIGLEWMFVLGVAFTKSRAGAVSVGCSLLLVAAYSWRNGLPGKQIGKRLVERLVIYLAFFAISGLAERATISHVSADKSIINRIEYWRAGLSALWASAWGFKIPVESDTSFYHNWVEPQGVCLDIPGFHSTFVSLGIVAGTLTPIVLLSIIIAAALAPLSKGKATFLQESVGASGIALLFCHLVSTLTGDPLVTLLGICWLVLAMVSIWTIRAHAIAAVVTISVTAVVGGIKLHLRENGHRIECVEGATGIVYTGRGQTDGAILIASGDRTFGPFPGKVARAIATRSHRSTFVLSDSISRRDALKVAAQLGVSSIVLGGAVACDDFLQWKGELILFHPIMSGEFRAIPSKTTVILPEIDEVGQNQEWRAVAAEQSWTVITLGTSQNCSLKEVTNLSKLYAKQ